MPDVAVERWQDVDALERHAPEWRALFSRVPSATPFESPAWLIACARHLERGALHVVAARAGGRLVAVAPLVRAGEHLVPLGRGPTDYHDVLVEPGADAIAIDVLAAEAREARAIELDALRPEAWARRALDHPRARERLDVEEHEADVCPAVALPTSATSATVSEDVLASIPSGLRDDVRRARRRLGRRGGRLSVASAAELPGALDDLFRLHAARWSVRAQPGVLASQDVQRFHREAAPRLHDDGLLRLHRLHLGDLAIGALLGFLRGARAYFYLTGFDPAFRGVSPGAVLVAHTMEDAVASGATTFDFLRGGEAYKYAWGAIDVRSARRVLRAR